MRNKLIKKKINNAYINTKKYIFKKLYIYMYLYLPSHLHSAITTISFVNRIIDTS